MKTRSKALLLTLCAVLLVAASVLGTMAYLTDKDDVTNVFTVGQIGLSLDEAEVNEAGQKLDKNGTVDNDGQNLADRVSENKYHLIPGHTYSKDPVVHVDANSEDAWIFIKVDNNGIEAIEETKTGYVSVAKQIESNGWTWMKNDGNVHYFYKEYTKNQDDKDLEVFQSFQVGEEVTNEQLKDYYEKTAQVNAANTAKAVIVTAYAVQKDGFATAADAWDATFGK